MFKEFIEKLQAADEGRKRKWMIISTTIVMAVVIYVWLGYFNNLIARLSQPVLPQSPEVVRKPSFLETMKTGAAAIYEVFSRLVKAPKEYIIKP